MAQEERSGAGVTKWVTQAQKSAEERSVTEARRSSIHWNRVIWGSICAMILLYNGADHWLMGNPVGVGTLAAFLALILVTQLLVYLRDYPASPIADLVLE